MSARASIVLPAMWVCIGAMASVGCHSGKERDAAEAKTESDAAPASAPDASMKRGTIELDPQERTHAGIRSIPGAAVSRRTEIAGYGVVLSHDTIAQAVAELRQAEAIAAQSRAALARAQHLANTPGAMSADQVETALRQSAVDSSGASLARQKLSALIGRPLSQGGARENLLRSLADGERKLLRTTFAAGDAALPANATIRVFRLGSREPQPTETIGPAWAAPADPSIPGRSYFAVLAGDTLAEGERVTTSAMTAETLSGVIVPPDAVVLFDARPWFYVEHANGAFARLPLDTNRRVEGGYALSTALGNDDRIVVEGAAILLAKEQGVEEPD